MILFPLTPDFVLMASVASKYWKNVGLKNFFLTCYDFCFTNIKEEEPKHMILCSFFVGFCFGDGMQLPRPSLQASLRTLDQSLTRRTSV